MKKNMLLNIVVTMGFMLLSASAHALTPVQQLEKLMNGFSNYSANFEQSTADEKGRKGEVSTGKMYVKRPNSFRWKTTAPFPQLIVSDGDYVWIYDEDLEQATRKKVTPNEMNGAALILNGNVEALRSKFDISQLIDKGSEKLFELSPKKESNFEKIQLYFSAGIIKELLLVDIFGKQTTIVLTKAKLNQRFKPNLFKFKPPKGTDVMTEGASS